MPLVCFCCVSETVLTINRRWCLFVGSDNKKLLYLSVPLAIAVGNKKLQSSWCADSQGSGSRRKIVRARFSNFCGLARDKEARCRNSFKNVVKESGWKKTFEQFQVTVCWSFKCLLEKLRTICFAVVGWRICLLATGDSCGQAWSVAPGDFLVNSREPAWRRSLSTALGSTRGSPLNVRDLRAST